jgi:hypothetical protein
MTLKNWATINKTRFESQTKTIFSILHENICDTLHYHHQEQPLPGEVYAYK